MCHLFSVTVRYYLSRHKSDPEEVGYELGVFKGREQDLQRNRVSAGGLTVRCWGAWGRSLGTWLRGGGGFQRGACKR